jgi:hypothetical protein
MKLRRPQSLNGLVLVGFGFVALPLLLAVIWALVNLDRVAEQSERLVFTGVSTAENNRRLKEKLGTLERVALQYQVLRNPDSLQLMQEDLAGLEEILRSMAPLVEEAGATGLADSIGRDAVAIVDALSDPDITDEQLGTAISRFKGVDMLVGRLTDDLTAYVDGDSAGCAENLRLAGGRARAGHDRARPDLHISRRAPNLADRPGDPPARPKRFFKADPDQGTNGPRAARAAARMAARAAARTGPGEEQVPASHVA